MTSQLVNRTQAGLVHAKSTPAVIRNEGLTVHYGGESPWPNADRSGEIAFYLSIDHDRCFSIWRGWQSFHMAPVSKGGRGWNDIAYNSGVCPHGVRFEGRGLQVRSGANGTTDGNRRSCAVVYLAGGDDPLTTPAMAAFKDEAVRHGVPLSWNHSDWKSTSCAGPNLKTWQHMGWPLPDTIGDDEEMLSPEVQAQLNRIESAVVVDISLDDEVEPALKVIAAEQYNGKVDQDRYTPPWKEPVHYGNRGDMTRDNLNNAARLERVEDVLSRIAQALGIQLEEHNNG